ncbi:MAG: 3-oxoacyl-[acyl-carrier-protein] reductase FabG [Rhodocyclaceae bacterium]|nr:3-oxoacyl-[acyl-carrier-protein] reductase FabG [Rhodocyclaceae bacterium]
MMECVDGTANALAGKVVLVTGGGRRVGAEIVRTLHARGACIALHYHRSADEAGDLLRGLNAMRPDSAEGFALDLLDTSALAGLIDSITARFGRLDGLVNNASSFFPTPVGRITESDWDQLVGSNFKAPLFLSQAAAPALATASGAIVNITDIHGERPLAGYPLYSAAKAALIGLTRALAVDLAPAVRVNAVSPGPILWPETPEFDEARRAEVIRRTPLARIGGPQDIAGATCFLLFEAPYISGQILAVDGGRLVQI